MTNENQALETTKTHLPEIPSDVSAAAMEMAVGMGDFSRFTPADCLRYLNAVCLAVGLNPLTLPIRIMEIDARKVMYATAECAAQLRSRDNVTIKVLDEKVEHGCYVVRVIAKLPNGREQENVGVLSVLEPAQLVEWQAGRKSWVKNPRAGQQFEGQAWANAVMKCHTKAARRATLAICGLGLPDEPDDDLKGVKQAHVESVTETETSQDRAEALNSIVQTPVEAEVIPHTTVSIPSASNEEPKVDKAPEPPVIPPQSPPTGPVTTTVGLPAETVTKLKAVIEMRDGKPSDPEFQLECKLFLKARGYLERLEDDLGTLKADLATKIINKPAAFYRSVETWAKSPQPATA